jgi:hypothetical protein
MPDNSILWISASGAYPRTMFERSEGDEVYVRYSWDTPPATDVIHYSTAT